MGTICIIDDDDIYKLIFRKELQLSDVSLDLIEFKNGADAISYFNSIANEPTKFPQIVLLDINMPISDGWDFLENFAELKANYSPQTLIFIVSSGHNSVDYMRAKAITQISGYFVKPISANKMKEIINSVYKI